MDHLDQSRRANLNAAGAAVVGFGVGIPTLALTAFKDFVSFASTGFAVWYLSLMWGLFAASVVVMLASYLTSHRAHSLAQAAEDGAPGASMSRSKALFWNRWTVRALPISITCLIAGIVLLLLVLYAGANPKDAAPQIEPEETPAKKEEPAMGTADKKHTNFGQPLPRETTEKWKQTETKKKEQEVKPAPAPEPAKSPTPPAEPAKKG